MGGRVRSDAAWARIAAYLPKWHSGPGLQRPKKPGKTGQSAQAIECGIGKLRGRDFRRRIVARYASSRPLASGWMLGPEKIEGKAALVVINQGKGQVILFAFPPQYRGQTHGTLPLLFSAVLGREVVPESGL